MLSNRIWDIYCFIYTFWHGFIALERDMFPGLVVLRLINTNPRFHCNLGFFTFRIILSIYKIHNQILDKKNCAKFFFKASNLKSDFELTLDYLNSALNNLAIINEVLLINYRGSNLLNTIFHWPLKGTVFYKFHFAFHRIYTKQQNFTVSH